MRNLLTRSVLVVFLAAAAVPLTAVLPAAAAPPTAGQSTYVPVDPVRLFDTREGTASGDVPADPMVNTCVLAYASDLKVALLGVEQDLLDHGGAVQAEVAMAMATGSFIAASVAEGVAIPPGCE